MTVLFGL